jgi:hypothetical protein
VARTNTPIITKHTAFHPVGKVCMKMGLHTNFDSDIFDSIPEFIIFFTLPYHLLHFTTLLHGELHSSYA